MEIIIGMRTQLLGQLRALGKELRFFFFNVVFEFSLVQVYIDCYKNSIHLCCFPFLISNGHVLSEHGIDARVRNRGW